jgi:hypothetical protein
MLLALLALLIAPAAALAQDEIPQDPDATPPPEFVGEPARHRPVYAPAVPAHPFMAPAGRSNIHVDPFQTDTNTWSGPLGRATETVSHYEPPGGVCGSVTFDSRGRIVTTCLQLRAVRLKLFDPRTLEELAAFELPPRPPSTNPFQDFAGGGYFYLDDRDRAVIPTTERHIFVVALRDGGFEKVADYDLTAHIPDGSKIISALPDWGGVIWFATTAGVVGTVAPETGAVRVRDLGEVIQNSFAVGDDGGVYIVSEKALYRFDSADARGGPAVTWREAYPNTGEQKPGQVSAGSGTTPTLHGDGWVSITDNADPMNVVVYKRAARVRGERVVCSQAVFEQGAGSTDNSLIGAGHSLIVENNYGYTGPTSTTNGARTQPGIERVDVDADGRGCRKVWRSNEISPSVVPKLSLANGLVYAYTLPEGDSDDPWYLTALDFRTGKTRWRRLVGQGIGFNNNYAPVTLGPDGTAYVGVLGGLALVRDARPPRPFPVTTSRIRIAVRPRRAPAGARVRFRLRASAPSGGVVAPVRGAFVRIGRRTAVTGARGRARLTVRIGRRTARYPVRATKFGHRPGRASVRVTR